MGTPSRRNNETASATPAIIPIAVKRPCQESANAPISKIFGLVAVVLASINIFGGFIVTYRMLSMFKSKTPKKKLD